VIKLNVTWQLQEDVAFRSSIPTDEEIMPRRAGGIVKRTGWKIGDFPTIYDSGTVWVNSVQLCSWR